MMEKPIVYGLSISKHFNSKIEVIESSLHKTIYNFRDFVTEFEEMHMMTESVKKQIIAQKDKCERKCCIGAEELKKVIESKENIIKVVALALTKLNETKDLNILTEVFSILSGESNSQYNIVKEGETNDQINSDNINIEAMTLISSKEEPPENMSIEEQDVSVSEIDGTPTGRHSPIIQSKKLKSSTNYTALRDKKKCPQSWLTPEKKNMKVTLTYPTPTRSRGSGRLRQQRITLVREKPSTVVDLTTTPQFSKGRNSQAEECVDNIKQEVIENDDTIMPSPTSGPMLPPAFKSLSNESPQKFKKPLSLMRAKAEKSSGTDCKENTPDDVTNDSKLEESVDLLKEYPNDVKSSTKCNTRNKSPIQANDSVSLLHPLNDMETTSTNRQCNSPVKRPLAENINAVNTACDVESSMSILRRYLKMKTETIDDNVKRSKCKMLEPLYREPTVRKKSEKRALPGWSCEQCKNFYGVLYKDNLEMQAKKMDECSKHRGHNNPLRPKTPPGYWYPRWDVPEDTEEFNKRNNAV